MTGKPKADPPAAKGGRSPFFLLKMQKSPPYSGLFLSILCLRPQVEACGPRIPAARTFIVDFPLKMSTTKAVLNAVKASLSPARIGTYETATGALGDEDPRALALYAWNAEVSAALLAPLHICEVVMRNAAAEALEAVYGPRWPWEATFILSLPNPSGNQYSSRRDLMGVAARQPSTGKVIPELKFVFWQEMFTHRHDVRLWDAHLRRVFPCHNPADTVVSLRRAIYQDLEAIRRLRNRIAHHEPIFTRNLKEDFERIVKLVEQKSALVASWMVANQTASHLIPQPPVFRGGKLWMPAHEEVAQLANRLWCDGGKRIGCSEQDWVSAERLMGRFD